MMERIEPAGPAHVGRESLPLFNLTLETRNPPESRRSGGDFAEITQRPDGSRTFIVGDASPKCDAGRRHAAFLLMSYRSAALWTSDPSVILKRMNAAYCRFVACEDEDGHFAAVIVASLFSSGLLVYGSAGAPPALLFAADANHHHLEPTGSVLGISMLQRYAYRRFCLHRGDALLLFSDGVTEARSGSDPSELLGTSGLTKIIRRRLRHESGLDAAEILDELAQTDFTLRDDATLLCCAGSDR